MPPSQAETWQYAIGCSAPGVRECLASVERNVADAAIQGSLSPAKRAVLANGISPGYEPCFILLRAQKNLVRILKHYEDSR